MEQLQTLNKRLEDNYGRMDLKPYWRIVWSEDELEKRLGTFNDFTREGIYLRTVTEVREVPKYRQWIHNKYVLERLTEVPIFQQDEVLSSLSYEPIWVFEDAKGNPLPPKWEAIELIIMSVYGSMGQHHAKYSDDSESIESKTKRILELQESLFGNETEISDALAYREGISLSGIEFNQSSGVKNAGPTFEPTKTDESSSKSTGQINDSINFSKRN